MPELHMYEVIRRPVITEKSNRLSSELNQYVFEVALNANKIQIREAVEVLFDVEVIKVNTMIMPAKRGTRGRKSYIRSQAWKKAIVTLKEGQQIKLFDV
ncbi:MAG: 50S ribosomal protein L23 [Anaerolineae bacterium]|jgi:large subunit ribosomal protein L23|nr:50S ribosomal protein L23 [Anaerolineae bacterium]